MASTTDCSSSMTSNEVSCGDANAARDLESYPCPVLLFDTQGLLLGLNSKAVQIHAGLLTPGRTTLEHVAQGVEYSGRKLSADEVTQLLHSNPYLEFQQQVNGQHGPVHWLLCQASHVQDPSSGKPAILLVQVDISSAKQQLGAPGMEQSLREQMQVLQRKLLRAVTENEALRSAVDKLQEDFLVLHRQLVSAGMLPHVQLDSSFLAPLSQQGMFASLPDGMEVEAANSSTLRPTASCEDLQAASHETTLGRSSLTLITDLPSESAGAAVGPSAAAGSGGLFSGPCSPAAQQQSRSRKPRRTSHLSVEGSSAAVWLEQVLATNRLQKAALDKASLDAVDMRTQASKAAQDAVVAKADFDRQQQEWQSQLSQATADAAEQKVEYDKLLAGSELLNAGSSADHARLDKTAADAAEYKAALDQLTVDNAVQQAQLAKAVADAAEYKAGFDKAAADAAEYKAGFDKAATDAAEYKAGMDKLLVDNAGQQAQLYKAAADAAEYKAGFDKAAADAAEYKAGMDKLLVDNAEQQSQLHKAAADAAEYKAGFDKAAIDAAEYKAGFDKAAIDAAEYKAGMDKLLVDNAGQQAQLYKAAADAAEYKAGFDKATADAAEYKAGYDKAATDAAEYKAGFDKAATDAAEYKAGMDKLLVDNHEQQAQLNKAAADAAEYKAGYDKAATDAAEYKAGMDKLLVDTHEQQAQLNKAAADAAEYKAGYDKAATDAAEYKAGMDKLLVDTHEQQAQLNKAAADAAEYKAGYDKAATDAAEFKAGMDKLLVDTHEQQAQLNKAAADAAEYKAGYDKAATDAAEYKAGMDKLLVDTHEQQAQLNKAAADAAEYKAGMDKATADAAEFKAGFDKAATDAAEFKAGFDKLLVDNAEQQAQLCKASADAAEYKAGYDKAATDAAEYKAGYDKAATDAAEYKAGFDQIAVDHAVQQAQLHKAAADVAEFKASLDKAEADMVAAKVQYDELQAAHNEQRAVADKAVSDAAEVQAQLQQERQTLTMLQSQHNALLRQQEVLQAELMMALGTYKPSAQIDAGTPADKLLAMMTELLDGSLPSLQDILLIQSTILESRNIYQPFRLGKQLLEATQLEENVGLSLIHLLGDKDSLDEYSSVLATVNLEDLTTRQRASSLGAAAQAQADEFATLQSSLMAICSSSLLSQRLTTSSLRPGRVAGGPSSSNLQGGRASAMMHAALRRRGSMEDLGSLAAPGEGSPHAGLGRAESGSDLAAKGAGPAQPLATVGSGPVGSVGSPEAPIMDQLELVLSSAHDWQFDAFALAEASCGHPLSSLAFYLFHRNNLISTLNFPAVKLARFLRRMEEGYKTNPYHNATHAADVLQTLNAIIFRGGLAPGYVDPLHLSAAYVAAVIHDYEHGGFTNDFLVNCQDDLAIRYNDRSPLENHHLAAAFGTLRQLDYCFAEGLTKTEADRFRKVVIELVLATDMKQHFNIVSHFTTVHRLSNSGGLSPSVASGSVDPNIRIRARSTSSSESAGSVGSTHILLPLDENERLLSLQMAIKCADIGHCTAALPVHKRWVALLEQEFFLQGDVERSKGMPISPLFDRNQQGITKSQVGFFDVVVIPLYHTFGKVFGSCRPLLTYVLRNYNHWTEVQRGSPTGQAK